MEQKYLKVSATVEMFMEDVKYHLEAHFSDSNAPYTVSTEFFLWQFGNDARVCKTLVIRRDGVEGRGGIVLYVQPFVEDAVFICHNTKKLTWNVTSVTTSPVACVSIITEHLTAHSA